MSSLEFLQNVSTARQQNPFLDDDGEHDLEPLPPALQVLTADTAITACATDRCPGEPFDDVVSDDDDAAAADKHEGSMDEVGAASMADGGEPDADAWGAVTGPASLADQDFDHRAANATLAGHLQAQLRLLRLSPRDMVLARFITELLDDDGYLRCDPMATLAEMDAAAGADAASRPEDMQIAIRRVQSLEPAGVGARDVQECLKLQTGQVECPVQRKLVQAIVAQHLKQVATHDDAGIAATLGQPLQDVEAACARIRHFNPRPGWCCGDTAAAYVTPDVVVQRRGGRWVALLNAAVVPRVRLSRQVVDLYKRCRQDSNRGLASQLQDARWTLRNIEQRFCTIVQVAQAIVDRQQRFFEHGEMAMKPLGLREVAQAVGVHESTVSRVINGKYIGTTSGVVELRRFFSRTMVMPSGTVCSATAIRSLLRDMIAEELPTKPLTDVDLTERLRVQGFPLARRTVTKYRLALRIESASQRHVLRA